MLSRHRHLYKQSVTSLQVPRPKMLIFAVMPKPHEFAYLSSDYERAWILRKEVLLDPFRIDHDAARSDDHGSFHFGIFDETRCVACLFLVPRSKTQLQMRQVAVAASRQRNGLGRVLVEFAEDFARAKRFISMTAHARDTAVPFYKRLGYEVRGEPFLQVGIQHYLVEKALTPESPSF